MRVRVLEDWQDILKRSAAQSSTRALTLFINSYCEYAVYGLSWYRSSAVFGDGLFCHLLDDYGNLVAAPLEVLEIVDGAIPSSWIAANHEGALRLWPDLFFRPFFFDDLSESVPDVVVAFSSLREAYSDESAKAR